MANTLLMKLSSEVAKAHGFNVEAAHSMHQTLFESLKQNVLVNGTRIEIPGFGVFWRREVLHHKTVGGNVTLPRYVLCFKRSIFATALMSDGESA